MINGTWARFERMLSAPPADRAPDPNALIDQVISANLGELHPMQWRPRARSERTHRPGDQSRRISANYIPCVSAISFDPLWIRHSVQGLMRAVASELAVADPASRKGRGQWQVACPPLAVRIPAVVVVYTWHARGVGG